MAVKTDDPTGFMVEQAEKQGISCTTVKDGHVLIFTQSHLEKILETLKASGKDKCVVFVQRPDFNN